jgi:hypothetical protein
MQLFGINSKDINPLLVEPDDELKNLAQKRVLSNERLEHCRTLVANFWRRYYVEEAELLKSVGNAKFSESSNFNAKKKAEEYEGVKSACLN